MKRVGKRAHAGRAVAGSATDAIKRAFDAAVRAGAPQGGLLHIGVTVEGLVFVATSKEHEALTASSTIGEAADKYVAMVENRTSPSMRVIDSRSDRWRAAEARCTPTNSPPDALAIIEEEQAKWDAEHPEEAEDRHFSNPHHGHHEDDE